MSAPRSATETAAEAERIAKLTRRVGKAVVINARDVADARFLLDVVGLIDGPTGRELIPLDTSEISMPDSGTTRPGPGARTRQVTTPVERRPENCTTPAGLR